MVEASPVRPAAMPSTRRQHEQYKRMLDAAEELAMTRELDHVQMHDVAKHANVAIGTLYRYFPTKRHLFVSALVRESERLVGRLPSLPGGGQAAADRVADALVRALRGLTRRRMLAIAMIRSSNSASLAEVPDLMQIEKRFHELISEVAGLSDPTDDDEAVIRLLVHQWFGCIQVCLNGGLTVAQAEADLRRASRLLMRDWPSVSS
ncbi:TetR family transcriptional regulator [Mycobacteroides abscessus]|uniref:TetR family transcriptional regulator n=1 Tax=Mycobacteroides abscessus TaxID=36809 RepID=UPI0002683A83|nr:TetR family transcriptional regulator [Mycobacteroides abscessus]EIT90305.1 putative transcriptional regulator KstR [Mycobacteroides abscessus 4S-0303]RIU04174.1 TetR/AcrR family transcriptional regulator [Mycobacteroides abscessus]